MSSEGNMVKQQLMLLADLQELDIEIIDFEDEREKIPDQLENMEGLLLEKRKGSEEKENQISALEDELSERQRQLDLERLKLKNTRNKETAIQNIKQYEAFVKEVETQEKSSDELEEEIALTKDRIKRISEEKKKLDDEISGIEQSQSEEKSELDVRIVELDKTLEEMYDRRDEIAEKINEDIYLKYEYIAERKDGVAVAPVEHGHCSVCNMAIPPQMYNELIAGERFLTCPACNRILVYKESVE